MQLYMGPIQKNKSYIASLMVFSLWLSKKTEAITISNGF
jgi:hypothetical protein